MPLLGFLSMQRHFVQLLLFYLHIMIPLNLERQDYLDPELSHTVIPFILVPSNNPQICSTFYYNAFSSSSSEYPNV